MEKETFQKKYQEISDKMKKTFIEKNTRYGNSFVDTIEKYGTVAALTRITDKYNRMNELYLNKNLNGLDESIEDTMLDMANYLIMTVAYLDINKQ